MVLLQRELSWRMLCLKELPKAARAAAPLSQPAADGEQPLPTDVPGSRWSPQVKPTWEFAAKSTEQQISQSQPWSLALSVSRGAELQHSWVCGHAAAGQELVPGKRILLPSQRGTHHSILGLPEDFGCLEDAHPRRKYPAEAPSSA